MTERRLLEQIAARDEGALRELYGLYYPRLGRFLLRLTKDRQLAAEVINDVFLVVWQKAEGFRGDSSTSTWIMGIAYNKALKAIRAANRHAHTESLDRITDPSVTASGAPDQAPQGYATADPSTDSTRERLEDAYESINKLSAPHRAVMVLTYQFGYSYREISQLLGCPENTVKTRMYHARRNLRSLLKDKQ